jgi:hypothetical protein
MTAVQAANPIDDIVARAEEFMRNGLIKGSQCGPAPKREGTRRNRGKGRAFEWLCKHVSYDEKKCLFWPFSKDAGHPGLLGYCGKVFRPVRLMCLLAHGAPPSGQHQACQTCGRGNKGCIHPRHLAWKTQSEARRDEIRRGQRKTYGKGGKITPAEAAEIRSLRDTMRASEIAKMYGLSAHQIGLILRGKAHVRPWSFTPQNGRFYPRLVVAGRVDSLGGFSFAEQAGAAYESARMRARRGEPILLPRNEKPSTSDIRRWHQSPPQELRFGEREGELIASVAADQEQSVFLLHNALNDLHPSVKKFIIAASATGDLAEAADEAGLSQEQVAAVLPRLRVYMQRHLQ